MFVLDAVDTKTRTPLRVRLFQFDALTLLNGMLVPTNLDLMTVLRVEISGHEVQCKVRQFGGSGPGALWVLTFPSIHIDLGVMFNWELSPDGTLKLRVI